jgi:sugar phosphate isomerase/epimerase
MPASAVAENLPYIDRLGIERIYVAWMGVDALFGEKHDSAVEELKAAKALLDERGVIFGYHNHAHEYADGKDGVYRLMEDVDGYTAQLDLFWAKVGGHAPCELMKKYGDKLSCLHVKELDNNWKPGESAGAYPCAIVGEGQADCEAAIKLALDMGIDLFILEVEGFPCEWREYLKASCDNMKKFAQ